MPAIAGSSSPRVFLVGEAPGATEAEPTGYDIDAGSALIPTGRPFKGLCGKKLQAAITESGISFEDILVTNAIKHRPEKNKTPIASEYRACSVFLKQEIETLKPKYILALGAVPSRALAYLADKSLPAQSLRGSTFECLGAQVLCTWHPAYAFGYNRTKASELLEDIKQIKKLLGD